MKECVSDINDDKNEHNYKEKEDECIDETLPNEMEEGVNDRNDGRMPWWHPPPCCYLGNCKW